MNRNEQKIWNAAAYALQCWREAGEAGSRGSLEEYVWPAAEVLGLDAGDVLAAADEILGECPPEMAAALDAEQAAREVLCAKHGHEFVAPVADVENGPSPDDLDAPTCANCGAEEPVVRRAADEPDDPADDVDDGTMPDEDEVERLMAHAQASGEEDVVGICRAALAGFGQALRDVGEILSRLDESGDYGLATDEQARLMADEARELLGLCERARDGQVAARRQVRRMLDERSARSRVEQAAGAFRYALGLLDDAKARRP